MSIPAFLEELLLVEKQDVPRPPPAAPSTPSAPSPSDTFEVVEYGTLGAINAVVPFSSAPPAPLPSTLPFGLPHSQWSVEGIRMDLESNFLSHPVQLPVDHAQRNWKRATDISLSIDAQSSHPDTDLVLLRDPATGEHLGFQETPSLLATGKVPTSSDSTSLARAPAKVTDSFRGTTSNLPFRPGGFEIEATPKAPLAAGAGGLELDGIDRTNPLTVAPASLKALPPGFHSKIAIQPDGSAALVKASQESALRAAVVSASDILKVDAGDDEDDEEEEKAAAPSASEEMQTPASSDTQGAAPTEASAKSSELDSLDAVLQLPTEKELSSLSAHRKETPELGGETWAVAVDITSSVDDFEERVPDMAFKWPFQLDTFQKQAVLLLEKHESVFIAAHTSAGKTVVAEYAIALAAKHLTKAIYTSPIKALSNQKFRDFRNTFQDVGLLTGDVQIKADASCVVMTTEILRSMLYRGADMIRDVEWVIFDEVHYVNDVDRGVVWEEVIIMLPPHVNLVLLSATVPNTMEFAGWVGRTKRKKIHVISTLKRPVPLEHFLYTGNSSKTSNELFKIVDAGKNFLQSGYKAALDAIAERKKSSAESSGGNRGGGQAGRGGGASHRGGGGGGHFSGGHGHFSGGHGGPQQDRNTWVSLIDMLSKKALIPLVAFTFSKKRCESNADGLANSDLTTGQEKSEIHVFIENSVSRLKGTDRTLPQVMRMRDMLKRGVGVHHGGLLPIIKEMVELLFQRGLVKVLFATETFAMGVNMPARTVVFDNIRKPDGQAGFRDLLPGEYVQMAGRAGRRGLDDTGTVIILCKNDDVPQAGVLMNMLLGKATTLESRFRLTYNMMLNLLRVQEIRVEDMMKRSFSEFSTQKDAAEQRRKLQEGEKTLKQLPSVDDCDFCREDIERYYNASAELLQLSREMSGSVASLLGSKVLGAGRVVVVNNALHRNALAVILRVNTAAPVSSLATPSSASSLSSSSSGPRTAKAYSALVLCNPPTGGTTGIEAYLQNAPLPVHMLFTPDGKCDHDVVQIDAGDIISITPTRLKVDSVASIEKRDPKAFAGLVEELLKMLESNSKGVPSMHPVKDMKIQDMDVVEKFSRKTAIESELREFNCIHCPQLKQHYAIAHQRQSLLQQVQSMRYLLSDASLTLLPEYQQRLKVLQRLGYIDENNIVQMKGRVACEINTCDDGGALVVTELIFDNMLAGLDPSEIVALLSCLVFQEKSQSEPKLTERLEQAKEDIVKIAVKVAEAQSACGFKTSSTDYVSGIFKFGLVEVVLEWARGLPFHQITDLTDIHEGSIVRCITRLEETCRDVRNGARVIGDPVLMAKMEEAASLIKRDIVFAASLYTQ